MNWTVQEIEAAGWPLRNEAVEFCRWLAQTEREIARKVAKRDVQRERDIKILRVEREECRRQSTLRARAERFRAAR